MISSRSTYETLYEKFAKILRDRGLDITISTYLEDALFKSARLPDVHNLKIGLWGRYVSETEPNPQIDDTYCKFTLVISPFFSGKDFVAGLKKTFPDIDATDMTKTIRNEQRKKHKHRPAIIIKVRVDHLIEYIFPVAIEILDTTPVSFLYLETWEAIQDDFMQEGVDAVKNDHFEKIWHALTFENLRRVQSLWNLDLPFALLGIIGEYLAINLASFADKVSDSKKEEAETLTLSGIKNFLEKETDSCKKMQAFHASLTDEAVLDLHYTRFLFSGVSKDILERMSHSISLFDPFDCVHLANKYEEAAFYDDQGDTYYLDIPNYILMHVGFRSDMANTLKNLSSLVEYREKSGTEFILTKCASTLRVIRASLVQDGEEECKQVETLKILTQNLITTLEQKPTDFTKIKTAFESVRAEQALFEQSVKGKTPTLFSRLSAASQIQMSQFQKVFTLLTNLLNTVSGDHEPKPFHQKLKT